MFANNERGDRLNAIKTRFWSLLILSVASIRKKLLKTTHTEERSVHTNLERCKIQPLSIEHCHLSREGQISLKVPTLKFFTLVNNILCRPCCVKSKNHLMEKWSNFRLKKYRCRCELGMPLFKWNQRYFQAL